jgi:fatty acid desaturase
MHSEAHAVSERQVPSTEWVTFTLIVICYALFGVAVFWVPHFSVLASAVVLIVALVLHSSLSHEVLHGHPFASKRLSESLVIVSIGLFIPYIRFRDTHLAHHMDAKLTDPYEDPESNYLDPAVWAQLPAFQKRILRANNTLLGRMVLGPLVSQWAFMSDDFRAIRRGSQDIVWAWAYHIPGVIVVLVGVAMSPLPVWIYVMCAYVALSILKIRTFLEHQAHARASGRSVIIEDRGILAFLFLNNNLHVVHHMHPTVPWNKLPAIYWGNKSRYVTRNGGYVYASYGTVFRQYFWRAKDPVAHPLWPMKGD